METTETALIVKIKTKYLEVAKDILQIELIKDNILNSSQIDTFVNLNVFKKWCYTEDRSRNFNVGEWVICIDEATFDLEDNRGRYNEKGAGWYLGRIFKIHRMSQNDTILWEANHGMGVFCNYVRKLTAEEVEDHLLPF